MTSLNTYDDVIKYIEKRIPYYYGEYFRSSDLATCSSQMILKTNQTINIQGNIDCNLNATVNQGSVQDSLCVDVSDKLKALSKEERNKMFDEVIKRLENEQELRSALTNRTKFRKEFLDKLKIELHNIPQSAQISCNSNMLAVQDQVVTIVGDIKCDEDDDSVINIDSTLFATQQMRCLSGVVIDNLKRDNLLRQSFNKGDNQDCIYMLNQVSPCRNVNGQWQREYQASIIENKVGNGKCVIKEDLQLNKKTISSSEERGFFEKCTPDQCEVSNWNAWSPCYDVKNANGQTKKMQYRTRQMIKQGTTCPADKKIMKEERECPALARFATMMGIEQELEEVEQNTNKKDILPLWFKLFVVFIFFAVLYFLWRLKK
jgi:hypothetical protein